MKCDKCESGDLWVWLIPDPYYGYGHNPQILCDECDEHNLGVFYEKSHRYKPENDDYYLGKSSRPGPNWAYTKVSDVCWDCKQTIYSYKRGFGYYEDRSIYFCKRCYRIRHNNGEETPIKL